MSKQAAQVARSNFTDEEVRDAFQNAKHKVAGAAAILTGLGRGNVSPQLARYWRKQLDKPKRVKGPKVLLLDIETSPIEGRVWGLWQQNVALNQIVKDWNILSYCAKWLGSADVIYEDLREGNPADDTQLVAGLYKLLDAADIVIAQNGKRFDVPRIQARFLMQGYPPPSPFKVIDTLLMARQQFGLTSNKLEYMTDKLCTTKKRKHEKFPGMELWNQCLAGNLEAWEEMRLYNIDDVVSMEELYLILRPWYVGHPNVAIYFDNGEVGMDGKVRRRCPKCGSPRIKQNGWAYTQAGKYERMHCGGCGGWSRGRYTKNSKEVRHGLLSN